MFRGSNERQFGCQNLNLPFVTLCRSRFGDFKEYHTSDDNLNFINEKNLKKFNLDISFRWSFYTLYISRFLDLFYNFIKMDQDSSRVNHYLPIRNAIWTFEENIFENTYLNDYSV